MRVGSILKVGLGLVVALVVAIAAVVSSIDFNQYKSFVAEKVKEATGRDLHIEGKLDLALSLSPAVVAEEVSFSNAPWGSRPQMVRMRRVEAKVALLPLVRGKVRVERLVLIEPEILIETDAEGRGNWEFDGSRTTQAPEADDDTPTLHITKVRIKNGQLTYRNGASEWTTTVDIERLSAHSGSLRSPITLELKGAYSGTPLSVAGTLGTLDALRQNQTFPLEVTAEVGTASVTLNGSVGRPLEGKGIALAMTMTADSPASLPGLAPAQLSALGPVRLTAQVSDANGAYQITALQAKVGASDLSGEVTTAASGTRPKISARLSSTLLDLADFMPARGRASDSPVNPLPLDGLRAVDAHITLKARRLHTHGALLERVTTTLTLQDGRLRIKPLRARLAGGALSAHMTLDAKRSPVTLDLKGTYNGTPFSVAGSLGALRENQTFPLKVTARAGTARITLNGSVARPLEGKGMALALRAKVGASNLSGEVTTAVSGTRPKVSARLSSTLLDLADFMPARGRALDSPVNPLPLDGLRAVDAHITLKARRLRTHGALLERVTTTLTLQNGRLRIKPLRARLAGNALSAHMTLDAKRSPVTLDLKGTYNGTPFSVAGSLGALRENQTFPLKVTARAGTARITLNGSVARPLEGKGMALALRAKVGASDLSGEVTTAASGTRPKVSARLSSTLLDVADFMPTPGRASDSRLGAGVPRKLAKKNAPLASADPLPLDGLRAVDAHITLKARRLRTHGAVLERVNTALTLQNGRLRIKPLRARVAGGALSAHLALDASGKTATLSTNVDAKQVELGHLLEQLHKKNLMRGGKTNITIRLKGRGNSVRALMAGLNGRLLVDIGEGRIHNSTAELIGVDLAMELVRRINPLKKKERYTHLECGAMRFDIADGIATADKGIAARTRKVNVVGSGTVNLKTEKLNLRINPVAREGFDLGTGAFAKMVRLGGTLGDPKFEPAPEGILQVGASIGAAIATSGLSLIAEGLFRRAATDKTPCASALSKPSRKVKDHSKSLPAPQEDGQNLAAP